MIASTTDTTRVTLERMYAAAHDSDVAALASLMHPQVRVDEPSFLPYGGTYTGLDEFAAVFTEAAKVLDMPKLRIHSITAEDENAFAIVTVPLVDSAQTISIVEHWTVADGLITTGRIYWFDRPTET
ncbi:nuclear transport factor 2 family protein [Mycobacterium sp.]|uniref:nuclear transport factor 2 family protein n=1 Tax=Mycobacterium sp. TaxID=1785 RepID=UPI001211BA07|nr:nuclear transport factor 2 family protein [Mycobacterium sp.]TAM68264.1 MAG: nuclear transport factor 2 family protein [Mycobacterium sp.]